jgi:predicted nucleic acid-binding protein
LIIVDTGPLVAAANADDHDHDRCVAMFRAARRPWLVPQPVIAEVVRAENLVHGSDQQSCSPGRSGRDDHRSCACGSSSS